LAFEALYRFIAEGIRPKPVQKLPPYIVLRSNLDVLLAAEPAPGPQKKFDDAEPAVVKLRER